MCLFRVLLTNVDITPLTLFGSRLGGNLRIQTSDKNQKTLVKLRSALTSLRLPGPNTRKKHWEVERSSRQPRDIRSRGGDRWGKFLAFLIVARISQTRLCRSFQSLTSKWHREKAPRKPVSLAEGETLLGTVYPTPVKERGNMPSSHPTSHGRASWERNTKAKKNTRAYYY